ncbi:hypothetical protein B0H13DRAFT_2648674, partial [Mycena leptocephala]
MLNAPTAAPLRRRSFAHWMVTHPAGFLTHLVLVSLLHFPGALSYILFAIEETEPAPVLFLCASAMAGWVVTLVLAVSIAYLDALSLVAEPLALFSVTVFTVARFNLKLDIAPFYITIGPIFVAVPLMWNYVLITVGLECRVLTFAYLRHCRSIALHEFPNSSFNTGDRDVMREAGPADGEDDSGQTELMDVSHSEPNYA